MHTYSASQPPPLSSFRPEATSFFFDIDGTLAPIVEEPSAAAIPARMLARVMELQARGGAVAVVSGRSIGQIDMMLSPHILPAAGEHGATIRLATAHREMVEPMATSLEMARREANLFAAAHPGLVVEHKTHSFAVHYRSVPERGEDVMTFTDGVLARHADLNRRLGKMVAEITASARTKGDAVHHFMKHDPFRGRVPLFIGDDITDEDGIAAAQDLGGVGIKVGPGDTGARYRISEWQAFARWLTA